jgi:hypothetical protein
VVVDLVVVDLAKDPERRRIFSKIHYPNTMFPTGTLFPESLCRLFV